MTISRPPPSPALHSRRSRRSAAVAVACLVVCCFSPRAQADAYEATLARAVAAKERALEVNDPPHWEEALRLFVEADRIRSTKECKYELGLAAAQMHAHDLAVESYQAALDLGIGGNARARAEAFVSEHASEMGRIELLGPRGTVLRVRDQYRGTLPLSRPVVVFAGDVDLVLVHPDGHRETMKVVVRQGSIEVVDLTTGLRSTTEVARSPGRTSPSAAGAPSVLPGTSGNVPASAPPPSTGARAPGAASAATASAPIGGPSESELGPSHTVYPASHGSRIPGWPFLISGIGVAVTGGLFAVLAPVMRDEKREDLRAQCETLAGTDACTHPRPDQRDAAQSSVDAIATWKALQTLGWVGVGVGAASAALGAVLLATHKSQSIGTAAPPLPHLLVPELRLTAAGGVLTCGAAF